MTGRGPHLSVLLHHDVGVVAVSNSEDEGGNTITSTRPGEEVDGPVVPARSREEVRRTGRHRQADQEDGY